MNTLLNYYHWPGNVWELANTIEHAAVMSSDDEIASVEIEPWRRDVHLPANITPVVARRSRKDAGRSSAEYERAYPTECLRGGYQSERACLRYQRENFLPENTGVRPGQARFQNI